MILTTLLAAAALYGGPTPVLAPQNTSKETAEGVEILRRILVESLDKAFASETKEDHLLHNDRGQRFPGLVTTLWASADTVEHARAFHLPEVGLFFAFDLSLPVVAIDEKPAAPGAAPAAPGDEWERIRREMQGDLPDGVRAFSFQRLRVDTATEAEIDPKAIEKVIDLALQSVARHANRIEGLSANDTATLTLRLSGKSRTLFEDFAPAEVEGEGLERLKVEGKLETDGEETRHQITGRLPAGNYSAFVLSTGHEVREQHLVIRVPLGDLAALADSPPRLRQRAQINLY